MPHEFKKTNPYEDDCDWPAHQVHTQLIQPASEGNADRVASMSGSARSNDHSIGYRQSRFFNGHYFRAQRFVPDAVVIQNLSFAGNTAIGHKPWPGTSTALMVVVL
jgi:hypothetical protein